MSRGSTIAAGLLTVAVLACESGGSDEPAESTSLPEWPEGNDPQNAETPDAQIARVVPDVEVPATRDAAVTHIPLVDPTVSLKERFEIGERIRRQTRLERNYRIRVDTGRTATAQGASEHIRVYVVDVQDAVGGQIVAAIITVESDMRRALPVGRGRPQLTAGPNLLEGASFDCTLGADTGYRCMAPLIDGRALPVDNIVPQRLGMHPGRPAAVGESWDLTGRDAQIFLGIDGVDAGVHFTFDDDQASYRDQVCHHVSYSFSGTQPIELSGRVHTAGLSGSGHYYHCRREGAVLYHRQERDLVLEAPVMHGSGATPLERSEHIVLEEETTVEPRRIPSLTSP